MCVKGMIFTFCFEMFKLCSESDTSCSQLSSALSVISGNWRVELIRKIKITQAEVDVLITLMLQPALKNKYVRASCERSTTAYAAFEWGKYIISKRTHRYNGTGALAHITHKG